MLAFVAQSVQGTGPVPPVPVAADVVAAWSAARRWLDGFAAPDPGTPDALCPIRGAAAVCVNVRRDGRILGTGTDAGGGDLMLRRAAGRALGQLLAEPAMAWLPPDAQREAGRLITLELEIAGTPEPLLGRTYEQAAAALEPGIDGIAMRCGQDWAWLFPSQVVGVTNGGDLSALIASLPQRLGLTAAPLEQVQRAHQASLYRFRTIHLAQREPGGSPFQAWRGDRPVSDEDVHGHSIATMADQLAHHLLGRMWPEPPRSPHAAEAPAREPLGVLGDYRALADAYQPLLATPLEQAMTALALGVYARARGVDTETAGRAALIAEQIITDLQRVQPGEEDPLSGPASAAAIVLAMLHRPASLDDALTAPLFDGAFRIVAESQRASHEAGARPPPASQPSWTPHTRALLAVALACSLVQTPGRVDPEVVRTALDEAWSSANGDQRLALLPWIAWAEREYARAVRRPIVHAEAMRDLRGRLHDLRIGSPMRSGALDLHGGFVLPGTSRQPDAQSTRAAFFLASMLREPGLTPPEETAVELGRLLSAMRFIMQLSVRPECHWACRNPRRAAGGLRAATWDPDQPAAAQALGLLAAAESLAALDELSARPAVQQPDPAPTPPGDD
jgi:hypothetical protein